MELRRCYYCNRVLMRSEIDACCPACGSRRFREVRKMTDKEMADLESRGYVRGEEWKHHESPLG